MTHDEIADLLGAYALDAVEGAERDAVDAHLVDCARCRAEVQEHREVAALLAHGGASAPDGVWERIAGSLEAPPPQLRLAPVVDAAPPAEPPVTLSKPGRRRYWLPATAAAAVVLIAALGAQIRNQDQRIDELQVALADPLHPAYTLALEDPSSDVVDLTSADGGLSVRAAVTEDGRGFLRADSLPRLDDGRTYQLWGVAGAEVVSLGVLGADPEIVPFIDAGYTTFVVTDEAAPGVATSEQPAVVSGSRTT